MVINAQESPFFFFKNPSNMVKIMFWKISRKTTKFQKENYEIVKILGGFWEISNFLLLKFIFN
jgi:hypothetical protein